MSHALPLMRTFPSMNLHVQSTFSHQEIEEHRQFSAQVFRYHTEAMTRSIDAYIYEMEQIVAIHVQETSALLTMALEVNTSLQAIIAQQQIHYAQQQAEDAKKITQLEDQLAAEQMLSFRRYMSDNHNIPADTASLDLWDETDVSHTNTCSVQSIHDFVHLPMSDENF